MSQDRASHLIPLDMVGHLPRRDQAPPRRKEAEEEDPFEPVFVNLPSPPGFDAMGEMARCMVEEYAMMGFSAELLLKMFKNPNYQALYRVYEARGEAYVTGVLDSVFGPAIPPASSPNAPNPMPNEANEMSNAPNAMPNGANPMPNAPNAMSNEANEMSNAPDAMSNGPNATSNGANEGGALPLRMASIPSPPNPLSPPFIGERGSTELAAAFADSSLGGPHA